MSEGKVVFNWSDAWLLLAIGLASETGPATLETIIAAGDRINFAIFTADELESGLVRLRDAGYIVGGVSSFALTEKSKTLSESLQSKQESLHKQLSDAQEMLGAAAAPDEQPCANDLKYPGFSKEKYEEAVTRYQGYLR